MEVNYVFDEDNANICRMKIYLLEWSLRFVGFSLCIERIPSRYNIVCCIHRKVSKIRYFLNLNMFYNEVLILGEYKLFHINIIPSH